MLTIQSVRLNHPTVYRIASPQRPFRRSENRLHSNDGNHHQRTCQRHTTVPQSGHKSGHSPIQRTISYSERRLTSSPAQQSADLYELILNRHRASSFVITSNRAVDEWLSLFDDPILGNSALDRLANASYQIVIEGAPFCSGT